MLLLLEASSERWRLLLESNSGRQLTLVYVRKYNVPVDFDEYTSWRRDRQLGSVAVDSVDQTPNRTSNLNAGVIPERPEQTSAQSSEQFRSSTSAPDLTSSTEPVPYPASFARVVELITTGEPIPGIKDIPDTVLDGQESHSSAAKRRKPWEKDVQPGTDGPGNVAGVDVESVHKDLA